MGQFKQTDIGLIPDDWNEYIFSDAIEINPNIKLEKKKEYPFIEMKDLNENQKYVHNSSRRFSRGGARFQNGDTLFARITPCLENGKICQVKGIDSEIGFGSTEFLVFRGKNNITDTDFVYYLSRSDNIRSFAVQNMSGTSGRQRVTKEAFENLIIEIPSLDEQKSIAQILSSLDDKIELNQKMNDTLEKIAQAIFKHWFIDYEFPNEEGKPSKSSGGEIIDTELEEIPEGWKIGSIQDLAEVTTGKRPNKKSKKQTSEYPYPLIGASSLMGYVNEYLFSEPILVIGRVGTHGIVQRYTDKVFPSDNTLILRSKFFEYLYHQLKQIDYTKLNVGSTQPLITQTAIRNKTILIPEESILISFETMIESIFNLLKHNELEATILRNIHDSLLPKLMSGKIRV